MLLRPALPGDHGEIVDLANIAFRGSGSTASWSSEAEFIEGQRLTQAALAEDLRMKPHAHLLTGRGEADEKLLGSVWLEPRENGVWYLGLLAVRPDMQNLQLGRALLAAAERFARERGARSIRMNVIQIRDSLIAWYQRRGYVLTGEKLPFPYGDERFGRPLREDLHFVVLQKGI